MRTRKPTGGIKAKSSRALERYNGTKPPADVIYIICEGETEVYYFQQLCKHYRLTNIEVHLSPGSAPISAVNYAIEKAITTDGIDQIWCVFDRDEHKSFDAAKNKLRRHSFSPEDKSKPKLFDAYTIPCFELWFLLHFRYTTKDYSKNGKGSVGANVEKELKEELKKISLKYKKPGKEIIPDLLARTTAAIKNAKQLKKHNQDTATECPDINVDELVEKLTKQRT